MTQKVQFKQENNISILTIDDGKVNVFSLDMINQINVYLKKVPKNTGCLIIKGRAGFFSAGFDLKTLQSGKIKDIIAMTEAGYTLLETLYTFERPIIIAASGHVIGLGVFLLCCADYRIGITGNFKAHANEVVNGMVIPAQMTDLAANRILPNHFTRMFINGEAYQLEKSIETGLIDQVCKPEDLMKESLARALLLNKCMDPFYHKTKLIARRDIIEKIQDARKLS